MTLFSLNTKIHLVPQRDFFNSLSKGDIGDLRLKTGVSVEIKALIFIGMT